MSDSLIDKIRNANPKRKKKNIDRRLIKLGEEYGEANQAYLSVTSKNNSKKKTWDDVREELADVIIVALDILLTQMPDEDFTDGERSEAIERRSMKEIERKLARWTEKIDTSETTQDD